MPFEPGKSGNPEGGRAHKRKRPITEMFNMVIIQNPEKLRKACMAVLDKAAEGDIIALKEIADRVEGKALQSIDVTDHRQSDAPARVREFAEGILSGTGESGQREPVQ